jgi:hypothetical protein
MSVRTLRLPSIHVARHWLLTLIISILAGKCVSSLQELPNPNQPYQPIAVDGYLALRS